MSWSRGSLRLGVTSLLIGATLAFIALVNPTSRAAESPQDSQAPESTEVTATTVEAASVVAAGRQWILCGNTLHLADNSASCGRIPRSYGFVHLGARADGARKLEICNRTNAAMHGVIRPVGQASIWYNDRPGGGCYIRVIGYDFDRWRAYSNGLSSPWIHP